MAQAMVSAGRQMQSMTGMAMGTVAMAPIPGAGMFALAAFGADVVQGNWGSAGMTLLVPVGFRLAGTGLRGAGRAGRSFLRRPGVGPRQSILASRGGRVRRVLDSDIRRKSQLIRALDGTTPEAIEIAQAIRNGNINVRILRNNGFARAFRAAGGTGSIHNVAAFQQGKSIILRRGSASLVSDAVHEGVHALDELRGFVGTDFQWEKRAYFAERRFQRATGRPLDFPNWRDIYIYIRNNY